MISLFDIGLLLFCAWAGYRLWCGTTSATARAVALSSLLLLALAVIGP